MKKCLKQTLENFFKEKCSVFSGMSVHRILRTMKSRGDDFLLCGVVRVRDICVLRAPLSK